MENWKSIWERVKLALYFTAHTQELIKMDHISKHKIYNNKILRRKQG